MTTCKIFIIKSRNYLATKGSTFRVVVKRRTGKSRMKILVLEFIPAQIIDRKGQMCFSMKMAVCEML